MGYKAATIGELGDGYGFRKVRAPLSITAFGANVIVMAPPVSVVGVKPLPVAVTVTPLGPCVGESVSAGVVIVNDWGAVFVPEAMS